MAFSWNGQVSYLSFWFALTWSSSAYLSVIALAFACLLSTFLFILLFSHLRVSCLIFASWYDWLELLQIITYSEATVLWFLKQLFIIVCQVGGLAAQFVGLLASVFWAGLLFWYCLPDFLMPNWLTTCFSVRPADSLSISLSLFA